jgi:hypothetical protein
MTESLTVARNRVLRATGLMALVAAVLTVTVILPAEFGRDLTGFGKLTGLTRLAAVRADAGASGKAAAARPAAGAADPGAPADPVINGTGYADEGVEHGSSAPLAIWSVPHDKPYASGKFQIRLGGHGEIEWKATVARGDGLVYRWSVREGTAVHFELHGEPTEGRWPKGFYESYELGEAKGGQGSMVAPFTGHHGWYFVNLGNTPITVDVELVGYYADFGPVTAPPAEGP